MKQLSSFLYSVLGGVAIAIGGVAFLSCENRIVGAAAFCIGLFIICTFGFHLFTGKVGYLFENPPSYALFTLSIWPGNLVGTALVAYALRLTRVGPALAQKAAALCEVKLNDSLPSIFLLSILCNLLVFVAVDGFRTNPHTLGKYLGLFFGVMVFILCGFEHCVANMFYFSMANVWSGKALVWLLVMTLGNACGAWIIPLCRKAMASSQS